MQVFFWNKKVESKYVLLLNGIPLQSLFGYYLLVEGDVVFLPEGVGDLADSPILPPPPGADRLYALSAYLAGHLIWWMFMAGWKFLREARRHIRLLHSYL